MSPALFLDRDGIIIRDSGYAKDSSQVTLIPGISQLVNRARAAHWKVIVVTNQSGLGRSWIELAEYQSVSHRMLELLKLEDASVDAIYFAPFHEPAHPGKDDLQNPEFYNHLVLEKGSWDLAWRKPLPGMLWTASFEHQILIRKSILIGDRASDQVVGTLGGVKQTYLLASDILEVEKEELTMLQPKLSQLQTLARNWLSQKSELAKFISPQLSTDPLQLSPITIQQFSEVQFQ